MATNGRPKLIFPALSGLYDSLSPFSYAIMRFATGAILLPHGVTKVLNVPVDKFAQNIAAKGLPFPEALSYLTYFAESVAAACLAIGLLPEEHERPARKIFEERLVLARDRLTRRGWRRDAVLPARGPEPGQGERSDQPSNVPA